MGAKPGIILRTAAALAVLVFCLFSGTFRYHGILKDNFAAFDLQCLTQFQWVFIGVACIWFWGLVMLMFEWRDLWLCGFFLIAVLVRAANRETLTSDASAAILLIAVAVGKGIRHFEHRARAVAYLLALLAFGCCCHVNQVNFHYHGPRWVGPWDSPNIYGMLMSAGLLLTVGLLARKQKEKESIGPSLFAPLFITALAMAVGLLFSYSRGSWIGTVIGLLYLTKGSAKFRWRFVFAAVAVIAAVVLLLWNATSPSSSWYVKRMDLGRPSAQHRLAAWKAGFEIMWDHPLGVGWNKVIDTYQHNYLPPEGGAAAITTNDYLMLGAQLGLPALLCFLAYISISLKTETQDSTQIACRAAAIAMLVIFWFDDGLFELPTAAVFWITLELGTSNLILKKPGLQKSDVRTNR